MTARVVDFRRALLATLVVVSILDAVTTYVILRAGTGREMNPIAAPIIDEFGVGAVGLTRALVGVGVGLVLCRLTVLAETTAQRVVVWAFTLGVVAWWATITLQNTRYL